MIGIRLHEFSAVEHSTHALLMSGLRTTLRLDPAQNARASLSAKSFVSLACDVSIVLAHPFPTLPSTRAVGEDVGISVGISVGFGIGFWVGSM